MTHPGDIAITNALLLGVEFKGDETHGFTVQMPNGFRIAPYYSKRAAAIDALRRLGYRMTDLGELVKL